MLHCKATKTVTEKLLLVLPALLFTPAGVAQTTASSPHPDFAGIWNSATATPLERPAEFKDKQFFTPSEAAQWERQMAAQNEDTPAAASHNVGTYNTAFREFGAHVTKTLRTSIITDPSDGRIPALTPAAAAEKRRRQELLRHPDGAKALGLQDRCIIFPTAVPPMIPYSYNSNYQIVQTPDAVMLHVEMIHDTRIIALNGRAHLPSPMRLWMGDSVGHWEGETLVVDTTNFNDSGGFYGDAGGMYGWDRNLHVVERFSLLAKDTILYRFEIDDPSAFTHPWKGELTMSRVHGPIYEYACQEGNSAVQNLLNGYRAEQHDGDRPKSR